MDSQKSESLGSQDRWSTEESQDSMSSFISEDSQGSQSSYISGDTDNDENFWRGVDNKQNNVDQTKEKSSFQLRYHP